MVDVKISDLTPATSASGAMQLEVNDNGASKRLTVDQLQDKVIGTTNGMLVRSAANTVVARTIEGGTGVSITNGDGVAGNPKVDMNIATEAEARTGNNNTKLMTPLRVAQAVEGKADATAVSIALAGKADASAVTSALAGKADLVGGKVPAAQLPSTELTFATQAQAEAGTDNTRPMTPLRTAQAIKTARVQTGPTDIFTASGVFTKESDDFAYLVEGWGGGAGGNSTGYAERRGGGGGEYVRKFISASEVATTTTVTIGAGGAPDPTTGASNNSTGGDTSFGSHLVARGATGIVPGGLRGTPEAQAASFSGVWAGGAGQRGTAPPGNSEFGGGGGGSSSGLSAYGGRGGFGSTPPTAPGGGGGNGSPAQSGARGELRITRYKL